MKEISIALIMLATLCGAAQADTRGDVLSGIARCGAIADDHTWLNCIYGAAQPMRGQLGLPPAPASQVNIVPPSSAGTPAMTVPSARPKESGGFFSYVLGGAPVLSNVPLADYRFDSQGFFTVTLANGQVWEQRDGPVAHWREPAAHYIASISKGAVGSFDLTIAHEDAQYKVRRVH